MVYLDVSIHKPHEQQDATVHEVSVRLDQQKVKKLGAVVKALNQPGATRYTRWNVDVLIPGCLAVENCLGCFKFMSCHLEVYGFPSTQG